MVPVLRHGTRVCEVWALVLLCYLIRGCNSFANGTVSFSTTTLQTPTAITINFTTTHTLMANEVIHIYLPRFTRRLKEDMKFSTYMPSRSPTAVPTKPPAYSFAPTANPTPSPTAVPSVSTPPSPLPTSPTPTARPTPKPTPAASPSGQPTGQPTRQPTRQPTGQPTGQPSRRPTAQPSRQPTRQPSAQPSGRPTVYYYPYHRSSAPIQPTTPSPTQYYSQKSFVYDVVIGSLILSPSSIFVGAWTEGNWKNYNTSHKETNYPGGMITLSRAAAFNNSGMWIPNNQSISLVIYADNGIGAYCGFAGSDAPESTTRFTGTANNGNQNVNFDQRFLMLTNYSKFPWEYPMSVHMWPVNLYNGLKNRLLPNVSYVVPEWEGMGPGCTAVVGSKGCSGHGICDYCSGRCSCFEGYGGEKDVLMPALQAAPDCSLRTCPAGPAIADVALTATKAHRIAECSNAGNCNRQTGECECFPPWTGAACQRMRCPNDCTGHGECLSIRQIARLASMEGSFKGGVYHAHNIYYGKGLFSEDAMHSTERPNATVDFNENVLGEFSGPGGSQRTNYTAYYTRAETTQWDHDTFYACVCESSWSVGLDPGQTQMGEWFGPDCSQRHCPSGDDPFTSKNELHCNGINQLSDEYPEKGKVGNLCQVDCANRGVCDYSTGLCNCFKGSYGPACTATSRTGVYKDAATAPAEDYLPPFKSDNTSAYQQIELGVDDFGAAGADRRRALDGEEEEAAPVADNDQPAASNPFY